MSKSQLEEEFLRRLRAAGVEMPVREFRFARIEVGDSPIPPARPGLRDRLKEAGLQDWALDFVWPKMKLAAEIEGGTWAGGRHVRGAGYSEDCKKYNEAALSGWLVLRFTAEQIRNGYAVRCIKRAFRGEQGERA